MTELAQNLSLPLHLVSLTGHSNPDAMLDTEPNELDAARLSDGDSLGAQDGERDASLDDRLMHRDLKARIFGSEGRVTIGRYEVLRRIGRGGMGTVYVTHDPELDRKVALKVLRADRRSGRERMLQEARALARLAHPNVVAVHEVGIHDERVFVAMELVEGKTLRTWLEAGPSRTEIYGVFLQAARGLAAAHRAGLVHRDFKPDNVLIGDDGRVRVVDFGVAKATDSLEPDMPPSAASSSSAAQPGLTLTGQLLGTPAYMAPEQFLGASVDARTDVFAFCVVLHEALAGRRPFDGEDTAEVSRAVLHGQARPLEATDVPAALATLVKQGLSREADERPASLEGLITALEGALVPARPRRSRLRMAGAVLSAAGVLGGIGYASFGPGEPPAEPMVAAVAVVPTAENEQEVAAFAAITEAADDEQRLAAAEAFLASFGESGSEVRRAVAHATAGDVQWRRSCAGAVNGLCITEQPITPTPCGTPRRGRITQQTRDAALVSSAQGHLRAAVALAGVSLPEPESERLTFVEAIARTRVQLADADLEPFLTLEVPPEIDLDAQRALSTSAFKLFYQHLNSSGGHLVQAYTEVKKPRDWQWTLVAAARTGMASETVGAALTRTPVPASLDATQRDAYCEALGAFTVEPAAMARNAYAYCVEKAEEHDLTREPIVAFCRARLELYPQE
jgi:serine/threonine protein kinase